MNSYNQRSLAYQYHENTKKINVQKTYDPHVQYKIYPSAKKIKLKSIEMYNDELEKYDFFEVLIARKSVRKYSMEVLDFEQISRMVTLSFGLRGATDRGVELRTYASAGARYPIEVYLVVLRSKDIEKGIYHYNVKENSLEFIKKGNYTNKICNFYKNQEFVSRVPCVVFFSMVPERTMMKYGERGYRFVYLDAGHMGQNLYLTASYLNLGVVALGAGGISDNFIDNLIGINQIEESVFYGFAVGKPEA